MNTRPAPEHGTWQRYACKRHPCRLDCCREPWRVYSANRKRQIAYGRLVPSRRVDATPAREHLAALSRQHGIGVKPVALLAGIASSTVERIANGGQRTARQGTVEAILAVEPDPMRMSDRTRLDGTGTRRRLQALVAIGWPMTRLAERLGCSAENVRQLVGARNGHFVRAATHRNVAALYDQLWNVTPAGKTHNEREAVRRARARAELEGWPPPLAWDDDSIDDPGATPNLGDDEAEQRKAAGLPPLVGRKAADVADDVEWIFAQVDPLATAELIAQRLRMSRSGLQHALRRAERPDLLDLLNRNASIAGHNVRRQTRKADAA